MKKIFLLAVSAVLALGAAAQNTILNNPSNKPYFGARVSVDALIPSKFTYQNVSKKVFGVGPGVSIGLVYNIPVVANFTVEPGVEFYYGAESINTNELLGDIYSHRSVRKSGMRVPVQLGYHFDFNRFKFGVFTGPVLNVGFSSDAYITSKEIDGESFHTSGSLYNDEGLNRVDCAWRLGVGFTFDDTYYIGLSGDMGMTNLLKKNDNGKVKFHDNAFHLTLGYNF